MTQYSKFFNVMDPNIRNTAMLLETAEEAFDDGDIDIDELAVLMEDVMGLIIATDIIDGSEEEEQLAELRTINESLLKGKK